MCLANIPVAACARFSLDGGGKRRAAGMVIASSVRDRLRACEFVFDARSSLARVRRARRLRSNDDERLARWLDFLEPGIAGYQPRKSLALRLQLRRRLGRRLRRLR
jgi:hypothetical protein